jgi:hypothetical protein
MQTAAIPAILAGTGQSDTHPRVTLGSFALSEQVRQTTGEVKAEGIDVDVAVTGGDQSLGSIVSDADYAAAKSFFELKYQLSPSLDNLSESPFATNADKNWLYSSQIEDSFSVLQPESLLNQTADILERALSARNTFNELATKASTLALELQDFFLTDEVHKDEVAKGIYTLPAKLSGRERNALNTQIMTLELALTNLKSAYDTVTGFSTQLAEGATVSALIPYMFVTTKLNYDGTEKPIKDWVT